MNRLENLWRNSASRQKGLDGQTAGTTSPPEHRKEDAQIKGGLSKAKTGSSGRSAASHATSMREPQGGRMREPKSSAPAKGVEWQHEFAW